MNAATLAPPAPEAARTAVPREWAMGSGMPWHRCPPDLTRGGHGREAICGAHKDFDRHVGGSFRARCTRRRGHTGRHAMGIGRSGSGFVPGTVVAVWEDPADVAGDETECVHTIRLARVLSQQRLGHARRWDDFVPEARRLVAAGVRVPDSVVLP